MVLDYTFLLINDVILNVTFNKIHESKFQSFEGNKNNKTKSRQLYQSNDSLVMLFSHDFRIRFDKSFDICDLGLFFWESPGT